MLTNSPYVTGRMSQVKIQEWALDYVLSMSGAVFGLLFITEIFKLIIISAVPVLIKEGGKWLIERLKARNEEKRKRLAEIEENLKLKENGLKKRTRKKQ
jgi:uncharacterized membrane protein